MADKRWENMLFEQVNLKMDKSNTIICYVKLLGAEFFNFYVFT